MKYFIIRLLTRLGMGKGSLVSCDGMLLANIQNTIGEDPNITLKFSKQTGTVTEIEVNSGSETFTIVYTKKKLEYNYVIDSITIY